MSRENDRFIKTLEGLDHSAAVTATQTRYFIAVRAMFLKELYSLADGAIDFTTGDETGQIIIDFATTVGGAYTTVHTETAIDGDQWTNGTPKAHVVSTLSAPVRIPAGAVVRLRFVVAGTTPSWANFGIHMGFQTV